METGGALAQATLRAAAVDLLLAVVEAPASSVGGVHVDLGFEPEARALATSFATAHARGDEDALAALVAAMRSLAAAAPARIGAGAAAARLPAALAQMLPAEQAERMLSLLLSLGSDFCEAAASSADLCAALLSLRSPADSALLAPFALESLCLLAACPGKGPASYAQLCTCLVTALQSASLSAPMQSQLVDVLTRAARGGHRSALSRCGAHTTLISLFAAATDGFDQCCLSALAETLRGCAEARERLQVSGPDALLSALLARAQPPTRGLLLQLARLACDEQPGGGAAEWEAPEAGPGGPWPSGPGPLRFAPSLPPLLHALRSAPAQEALPALRWLQGQLGSDPGAQCVAAQASLSASLLEWYDCACTAGDAELSEALAGALSRCASLAAVELMGGLQLCRRIGGAHRRRLVEALAAAAASPPSSPAVTRQPPGAFFSLPASGGGLTLQRPLAWPAAARGLALLLWLRLPDPPVLERGSSAATLLSMRGAFGGGLLVALGRGRLELHLWAPGGPPGGPALATASLPLRLPAGRWCSMALALQPLAPGGAFGEGFSAHLLLDGARTGERQALRLPAGRPSLAQLALPCVAVGCEVPPPGWAARFPPLSSVLLEGVRLFSFSSAPEAMAALRLRAASSSDADGDEAAGADGDLLTPLFSLSAAACSREEGVLMAHSVAPGAPPQLAALSPGTSAHRRSSPTAALQALGGLPALLPLLLDESDATAAAVLRFAARALPPSQLDESVVAAALLRRARRAPAGAAPELLSAAREAAMCSGAAAQRILLEPRLWEAVGGQAARLEQSSLLRLLVSAVPAPPPAQLPAPVDVIDVLHSGSVRASAWEDEAVHEAWQRQLLLAACATAAAAASADSAAEVAALDSLLCLLLDPATATATRRLAGEALLAYPAPALSALIAQRGGAALAMATALVPGACTAGLLLLARLQPSESNDSACSTRTLAAQWPPGEAGGSELAALLVLACGGKLEHEREAEQLQGSGLEAAVAAETSPPPPLTRPAALLILWRLLPLSSLGARRGALRRSLWLTGTASACASLAALPDWPQPLLPLLTDDDEAVRSLSRRLCATLHEHSLLRGGGGSGGAQQLERFAAWAELQQQRHALCWSLADALGALTAPAVRWCVLSRRLACVSLTHAHPKGRGRAFDPGSHRAAAGGAPLGQRRERWRQRLPSRSLSSRRR